MWQTPGNIFCIWWLCAAFFCPKRLCLATLYTLGPWYEHIDLDWSIRLMRNSAVQLPSPREKGVLVWCWQSSSPLGRMEELFHVFHRCYSYPQMYYALLFHVLLLFSNVLTSNCILCPTVLQAWNLSNCLHDWIFGTKILHTYRISNVGPFLLNLNLMCNIFTLL